MGACGALDIVTVVPCGVWMIRYEYETAQLRPPQGEGLKVSGIDAKSEYK
jgi:hypothetical protein